MLVHALLVVPGAFGAARWSAPETDVLRGMSSVELELLPPESPSRQEQEAGDDPQDAAGPSNGTGRGAPRKDDGGALSAEPPGPLQNRAPSYPKVARVQGWEGTVLVRARVAPSGGVVSVRVARSSGRDVLDGAAVASVRQWKFQPARRRGRAVASQVEVPITFRLEQQTGQQGRD